MASTRYDLGRADSADPIERQSSKPDYQVLIYPGIRAKNVRGTKDTPPTFMLCADHDKGPSLAIPALYLALKKEGVPAELHTYNSGGYGFGYRPGATPVIKSTWVLRLQDWMSDTGMSPAK
jgi:acetyl esterase/lipase